MLDVEVEAVIKNNQPVTTTQTLATFRARERDSCCVQYTKELRFSTELNTKLGCTKASFTTRKIYFINVLWYNYEILAVILFCAYLFFYTSTFWRHFLLLTSTLYIYLTTRVTMYCTLQIQIDMIYERMVLVFPFNNMSHSSKQTSIYPNLHRKYEYFSLRVE